MAKTTLPLAAVEAMCQDWRMSRLMAVIRPTGTILGIIDEMNEGSEKVPDWILAGANCKDPDDILPMCIHTFLLDWEEPK
jgi:hypothetical protein